MTRKLLGMFANLFHLFECSPLLRIDHSTSAHCYTERPSSCRFQQCGAAESTHRPQSMTDESSIIVTTNTPWKYCACKNPKSDMLNVERLESTNRLWIPMGGS